MNGYLRAEEVAEQLRVQRITVLDLARQRKIASTKAGRRVLFTQKDIDEYLALNRREALPPRRGRR